MKRVLPILLALLLLLTACGQSAQAAWQEQYDLGVTYLSDGNYEEAILAFTAAIDIDPKQPTAYAALAEAYIGIGDLDAARKALEDGFAATEDPDLQTQLETLATPPVENTVLSEDGTAQVHASGDMLTVSLTDPNLQESYSVNRPETSERGLECAWLVEFTDGAQGYEVGTTHWKLDETPETLTPYEMQSDVWLTRENGASRISEAELSISGTTLTWTFQVPAEYNFDPANMVITGHRIELFSNPA